MKYVLNCVSWNSLKEIFHSVPRLKGRIHWNFYFRVFHEIQLQGYFMKYEMFSLNTFTLVCQFYYVCFSLPKKCLYREKMSSDSENLIALILINNICYSKSRNKKNQSDQKVSEWNHGRNPGTTKVHIITYFQNFC